MLHQNTSFTLYIVRHGQSEKNLQHDVLYGRSESSPLTVKGERQATKLGKRLKRQGVKFDYVYSSPSTRAIETAKLATKEVDFPETEIMLSEEIVEYSIGDWADQKRADTYTPEVMFAMNTMGPYFVPPNGESMIMVQKRVINWLIEEILHNEKYLDKENNIAIFSHAMTIRTLLQFVMGFNDRLIHRVAIDNASLTKLRFNKDGWFVDGVNT